jgi:maltose alpha-D-glucosyltransferase/alpha-amylase
LIYDAVGDQGFASVLLDMVLRRRTVRNGRGELVSSQTPYLRRMRDQGLEGLAASLGRAEQSNSSIVYGDRLMLKLFRRVEAGLNPDLDIGRYLANRGFPYVPPLAGALEYRVNGAEPMTVGLLSAFVPNACDAWEHALDALGQYFDEVLTLPDDQLPTGQGHECLVESAGQEVPGKARDWVGTFLESARLLGERTAALHLALAEETEDPNFVPESFTSHYVRGVYQSMRSLTRRNFQLLRKELGRVPRDLAKDAERVLGREAEVLSRFRALCDHKVTCMRIRYHGDFHLGQVLYTGKDFYIVDFEGEPARALGERRIKRSPLRDVAGMIRSFDYAAHAALFDRIDQGTLPMGQLGSAAVWARFWQRWVSAEFFRAYRAVAGEALFLPKTETELRMLLDAFMLEKAVYELGYELNNRPDWLRIPLSGICFLLGDATA